MKDDARADALIDCFTAHFGRRPTVVVRAPGRVNLIGEHTDYNGLPVLPMAVERSVLIAAAPRDDRRVELANVAPSFPPRSYELVETIAPFPPGDWGNYHKAAAQGLVEAVGLAMLVGGDVLVDGNVPAGAGLSSSSALVVGSLLGLLAVSGRTMEPAVLAELAARAERYVGTLSGGMDQAVCLLARAGHALRIDFDPLRARPVPVPGGCSVIVCDSLVVAEKSGRARDAYNQRVRECRLACHVLARTLDDGAQPPRHLGDLWRRVPACAVSEWLERLVAVVPARPLRVEEIAAFVGERADGVARTADLHGSRFATYVLVERVRHVLSEAERVERAEAALAAGDWPAFGALMDASHASCRDDYAVSCPELEALVAAAKAAGALGARLTGAGFGGCTVNVVPTAAVPDFVAQVERSYYARLPAASGREHVFVFTPSAGASVTAI